MSDTSNARLYLDEDVHGRVASALRLRQFDVESAHEVRRWGLTDAEQLEYAAKSDRAIVTFNMAHFVQLHNEWLETGQAHAGIIVSDQLPIAVMVRRLLNLLANRTAADLAGRIFWLQAFK